MRRRRAGGGASVAALVAAALAVVAGLGLAVVTAPPAAADIASIAPASRDVDPGGSTSATVTVDSPSATCVSARASSDTLKPTFSRDCFDDPRWTTTLTVQVPDEPGTYFVDISEDHSSVGKRFTLRVRPPPPTTTAPPPTTTTTAPPTTTTTTTAAASTTTTTAAASTTTTAPVASTTTARPLAGDPFTPLAALAERPVPDEGVFLPLIGEGYRNCLPLTTACRDPGSGFVLVPARTTELTWQPVADGAVLAPRSDLRGIAPMGAAGVGPADPRTRNYALSVLDLTAQGGQLRTLVRSLDDRGKLSVVSVEQPLLRPVASGPAVGLDNVTSIAAMPFGRPAIRKASTLTEAAPALPMFASTQAQVVYAIRPDNGWGLNLDLLPLVGDSVPFLVRAIEGPPGLFIPRPAGLRVPDPTTAAETTHPIDGEGDAGGLSPVALLAGAVVFGGIATAAVALLRRRRHAAAEAAEAEAEAAIAAALVPRKRPPG